MELNLVALTLEGACTGWNVRIPHRRWSHALIEQSNTCSQKQKIVIINGGKRVLLHRRYSKVAEESSIDFSVNTAVLKYQFQG